MMRKMWIVPSMMALALVAGAALGNARPVDLSGQPALREEAAVLLARASKVTNFRTRHADDNGRSGIDSRHDSRADDHNGTDGSNDHGMGASGSDDHGGSDNSGADDGGAGGAGDSDGGSDGDGDGGAGDSD